jgi:RND family efflux transporter MFP subunit
VAGRDSRKSQVAFAVSKLNLARRDLEKTILIAPFDGVIANKFVEPFQEVARGEKVFEVYAEGAMEVVISVPETVIGKIHLGLPADVSFPAESIDDLKGRISEIGRVATEANAFPVKVALTDPPAKVLPGMTAEASLLLGDQGDTASYLVPLTAIIPGEQPKHGYVFVYDPETATVSKNAVRGGGVRDDRILIAEGLEAGQIVAVAGVSFLRDGQKVKLLAQ